ncbi:hypothetical protein Patl1_14450 [Pistacia atlantica]|uniref:Uncharacterized protein n=1 Tax=Pistacia atlantica TaxID=434234 RepID=A0ACC1AW65_9ROSI|nr:hypothetical protein Patl1_14450 [Pistacia atlantica]
MYCSFLNRIDSDVANNPFFPLKISLKIFLSGNSTEIISSDWCGAHSKQDSSCVETMTALSAS